MYQILQVITNLNGCTVLNINMIDLIILIILGGTVLCLIIRSIIINVIYTLKINRQNLLTDGYNNAINKINQNICSAEIKIKHTVILYQHYSQSLTKR